MSEITTLLERVGAGDARARDELYAVLYPELRKLARARLRHSETITLLETTALVHESYERFIKSNGLSFPDRGRFFAFASNVMRSVIIDAVRKRRAARRAGGLEHVELDDAIVDAVPDESAGQIIRVHEALDELSALDPRLAQVVEMRYFAGLAEEQIATALGVTERTVRRDWSKARALLHAALSEQGSSA